MDSTAVWPVPTDITQKSLLSCLALHRSKKNKVRRTRKTKLGSFPLLLVQKYPAEGCPLASCREQLVREK